MKTVLIVDDSEFMRDRLKEVLSSIGKEIIAEAKDGQEGIDLYKEHKPDLVFLDINMPGLSGRDALVQIMDFDEGANIVMCSTLGAENIVSECIEEGALHYVLKPFTKANVEEVITDISQE